MNYSLCAILIFIYIFLFLHVNGDPPKKTAPPPAPANDSVLKEGDCDKAVLADMVFQDHIRKPGILFMIRNATVTWHGDAKIYCLIVEPQKEQTPGSSVFIKDGGINHTFVNIEIHSKKNEGLDYSVQIFGKKVR